MDHIAERLNGAEKLFSLFDRLSELGMGRGLYVIKRNASALSEKEQKILGVRIPNDDDNTTLIRVGYILPVNPEETAHVVIDLEGQIAVLEAFSTSLSEYQQLFSVTSGTQHLEEKFLPEPGQSIIDSLKRRYAHVENIIDGRLPENSSKVKKLFEEALVTVQKRQKEIDEHRIGMRKFVIEKLSWLSNNISQSPETSPSTPPA